MFCLPKHQVHIQIGDVWLRPAIYPWVGHLAAAMDDATRLIVEPEQTSFLTWDTFHPERARIFLEHRLSDSGAKHGTAKAQYVVEVHGQAVGDTSTYPDVDIDGATITSTGSWLFQSEQGKGYGTALRCGMLCLIQAMGYAKAKTGWNIDNVASRGVSLKLGYQLTKLEGKDLRTQAAEINLLAWQSPLPVQLWLTSQHADDDVLVQWEQVSEQRRTLVRQAFKTDSDAKA